MARTAHATTHTSRTRPLPLSDLDHLLATATLVLAGVGALLLVLDQPGAGTVFGIAGLAAGLGAQMMSQTRSERWVDMLGMLAAFLVLAFGAAQGGLG